MPKDSLDQENHEVVDCRQCPRLIDHIQKVATEKVKRFRDWDYWGKPVPAFGDYQARIMIIGLAPAAHGANRTGRMFTGDASGDWLYRALYEAGFANQPESYALDDGMALTDIYLTASCRCAPPQNKPTTQELKTCAHNYLAREIELLANLQVVLCLGRVAFDTYRKIRGLSPMKFGHGEFYQFDDQPDLKLAYHPSRQNTQTGRLLWDDWVQVFKDLKAYLG